jgi:hypothetical protein
LASTAEFTPEPSDLIALNTVLLRRRWFGAVWEPLFGLALGAACAGAAAATSWPRGVRWPVLLLAVLGFLVGWLVYTPIARLQTTLIFRSAQREGLLVPQRLELTRSAFRATPRVARR